MNRAVLRIVVVTNQPGIAWGYFDWNTLEAIRAKMRIELVRGGARLDAIYVSPRRPDDGCLCRKAQPDLLL